MTCTRCAGLGYVTTHGPIVVCPSYNGWGGDEVEIEAYEFGRLRDE